MRGGPGQVHTATVSQHLGAMLSGRDIGLSSCHTLIYVLTYQSRLLICIYISGRDPHSDSSSRMTLVAIAIARVKNSPILYSRNVVISLEFNHTGGIAITW